MAELTGSEVFLTVVLLILFVILPGSSKEEKKNRMPDNLRFKKEYEELNRQKRSNDGKNHRTLTIPEDNPFIYKHAHDIVETIENEESSVVYFGYDSDPWCRTIIPSLIESAKKNYVRVIYYVDITKIRDSYSIDEDGNLVLNKEGSEDYYFLLQSFDKKLRDYTVTGEQGEHIKTGTKRIYAPTVVTIVEGKLLGVTSGLSEKQKTSTGRITEELRNDMLKEFDKVFKRYNNERKNIIRTTSITKEEGTK